LSELEGAVSGSPEQVIPSISKYLRLRRDSHIIQERFLLMLGGTYVDRKTADDLTLNGLSIWLTACMIAHPDVLRRLLAAGCSVAETFRADPATDYTDELHRINGWSCLFFVVLYASHPESSIESERLHTLLGVGADPFLRDAEGFTIFDRVNDNVSSEFAGYRRELWYNALTRAHIHIDHFVKPGRKISMSPVYSDSFTPTHCRALRHLESWEENDFQSQVDKLLADIPWSEEEAEALARVKDFAAEGPWSDLTAEGCWSDLTVEGGWSEESED
jgi:hypothetical protein